MKKIEGSGSICQRHRSADPDPDPHQNVIDPQHWRGARIKDMYLTSDIDEVMVGSGVGLFLIVGHWLKILPQNSKGAS